MKIAKRILFTTILALVIIPWTVFATIYGVFWGIVLYITGYDKGYSATILECMAYEFDQAEAILDPWFRKATGEE